MRPAIKTLARFPASRNRLAEKESRQINMLEHVLIAKPLRTLAGHALTMLGIAPEIRSRGFLARRNNVAANFARTGEEIE